MSRHTWVLKNIATYLAGGLDSGERGRLETHLAACTECSRAFAEAQVLDEKLGTLFAGDHPRPQLEERLIGSLRRTLPRRRLPLFVRVALGAAATILLAALGAGLSVVLDPHARLDSLQAMNHLKQLTLGLHVPVDVAGSYVGRRGDAPLQLGRTYTETNGETDGIPLQDADQLAQEYRETLKGYLNTPKRRNYFNDQNGSLFSDRDLEEGKKDWGATRGFGLSNSTAKEKQKDHFEDRKEDPTVTYSPAGQKISAGEGKNGSVKVWDKTPDKKSGMAGMNYYKPGDALLGNKTKEGKENNEVPGLSKFKEETHKGGELQKELTPLGEAAAPGEKLPPAKNEPTKSPEQAPQVKGQAPQVKGDPPAQPAGRKIIRSGEIEFEVDSFDNAVSTIIRLINGTKGGFVATVNSDKLPNGKVKGSVVVRLPPEALDKLVLDLRKELGKAGELKGQRIGSQDITKQYTDLESRLKAAKTMEERLLKIIREGKGEIKDLLAVEKELGVWRTRVEEMEGELKYYANQVALSTLSINLAEKEIRQAAAITESERVQAGIEVEDVEKAQQEALKAVAELKGRVTKSELKQHTAGQFNAVLHFEVAPDKALLMRDRLRQLGHMVRLETDKVQQTDGKPAPKEGKIERGDTHFIISIYNLANVAPRETVTLRLAAADVAAAHTKLREAVARAKGRVVTAQLNEQNRQNITAQLDFDIRRQEEGAILTALTDAGAVLSRQLTRAAESDNVTDTKVLFRVELVSAATIPPRKTFTVTLEVADVDATLEALANRVQQSKGRVVTSSVGQEKNNQIQATVTYEVPLADAAALIEKIKASGEVRVQQVAENAQAPTGSLALARIDVTISNTITPRKTYTVALEVADVDTAVDAFTNRAKEIKGARVIDSSISQDKNGRVTAHIVYEVKLAAAPGLVEKIKASGKVRLQRVAENIQAPAGELALARIEVTVSNGALLVPEEEGLWPQIRSGLSISLRGLSLSVSFLIVAVLFLLPWALLIWAILWVGRRFFHGSRTAVVVAATPAPTSGGTGPSGG